MDISSLKNPGFDTNSTDSKINLLKYRNIFHVLSVDDNGNLPIATVEPNIAYSFKGNFYGLLKYLNIPDHMFYLTLRLNKMDSEYEFDGSYNTILVYAYEKINTVSARL